MSLRLSIENHIPRLLFGDEKAIEMIAAAGFDAIDFSFYWMPEGKSILSRDDYLQYAAHLRTRAERNGIVISQAHAPFDLNLNSRRSKQAYDYEQIRRSIEFAGVLGAECIVIHNLPTPEPDDFFETNLAFFKSLEETARKSRIKIGVENLVAREENRPMPGRLGTPEELNAMLDQLDPEVFCACIDLGHAQLVCKDPAEFIRRIGTPRLQSIHVQDTIYHLDAHTLPYLGRQNWDAIASALAEVGYAGDFTLEVFLFLKALPKEALPDALKLAHSVGRSLIRKVKLAANRPESIAQHYAINNIEWMTGFLTSLIPELQGDYLCPSGETLRLHFSEYEPFSIHRPHYLFRLLSAFPHCKTLPTLEQIYSWIPDDFTEAEIPECMQWMDKIYAFFSSSEMTGVPSKPPEHPTDFFIVDGKLITCFQHRSAGYSGNTENSRPLLQDFVRIPDNVTSIESHAFFNCDMPIHVYLPANVKEVDEYAFYIDPDSSEEQEHRLFFIEHETGDVTFKGAPFNFKCWYDAFNNSLVSSSFYAIIAPQDSRAHQFAVNNDIDYAPTIESALHDFLRLAYDFEESRQDAADFTEVNTLFRKGNIAAHYVIRHSDAPAGIIHSFCRIAFGIESVIRNGKSYSDENFREDDAVNYLIQYGREEVYFRREELTDITHGFARTAVELIRRNSPNLERAILALEPDSVVEYIESLENDPNYNMCWSNMFFGGQEDTYSEDEFFALGALCARAFISNHSKNWEKVFDAAMSLSLNLTDEQRHGHFRIADLVQHLADGCLEKAYFEGKELTDDDQGISCIAIELMRRNSPNLERAILALEPDSVAEYIESLEDDPTDNLEQNDIYSEEEFFALGDLCAHIFIDQRPEGWEDVFDASVSLAQTLTTWQRYNHFYIGDLERWYGRPIPTEFEFEDEASKYTEES